MSTTADDTTGPLREQTTERLTSSRHLAAGGLAAIGASLCCVAPFALLMAGVGGAWISTLTALTPYRPIFIGLTLLFLALAFRKLYLVPRACATGKACAAPAHLRRQRGVFWVASALLGGLLAFPWYAPYLLA